MSLVTINGLVTYYTVLGKGKPMILLHGWGGSSRSFFEMQKLLAQHYEVFALDLPGFGGSDAPGEAWGVKEYMEFVLAFASNRELKKFFLVGHSFGGRIAIMLAAKHPDQVRALMLMAAAGIMHAHSSREKAANIFARIGRKVFVLPGLNMLEKSARSIFYKIIRRQDYLQAKGVMKEVMKKVIAQDLREFLGRISSPTLLIWGDKDTLTPLKDAYIMSETIPHAQLRIIKGASHYLPKKYYNETVEFINQFISSL